VFHPASYALVLAGSAAPAGDETPTWSRDVAPIVFAHCVVCHRPDGPAPFPLVTHEEVAKRGRQIASVTQRRAMPPWLPRDDVEFAGRRRLREDEIATLAAWVDAGEPEGDPAAAPAAPKFEGGWQLGPPDAVVEMDAPYPLAAEGVDELRNFVIAAPTREARWVSAIEIRFDRSAAVHHATLQVDETTSCRELDAHDPLPGFGGMWMGPSSDPGDHFVGWTAGSLPEPFDPGTAWRMMPGTDFVLQLHMVPTGRPELVRARLGLHFTNEAPTRQVWSLGLRIEDLDIPAGEDHYVADESFTVPVAAEATRVFPHAHYLGRTMKAWFVQPDGTVAPLLGIEQWDFNWQQSYRYANPIRIPAGSTIRMQYAYDNSDANPRNPNQPPIAVRLGNRTSDEMGTLSLELRLASADDRMAMIEAFTRRGIERHPADASGHFDFANVLTRRGRVDEAMAEYATTVRLEPRHVLARNNLANLLRKRGRNDEALTLLREAIALEPASAVTLHNLGAALAEAGDVDGGIQSFRRALAQQPTRVDSRLNLGLLLESKQQFDLALQAFAQAQQIDPDERIALDGLARGFSRRGDFVEAERYARRAVELAPDDGAARRRLAAILVRCNRLDDAITEYRGALQLAPDDVDSLLALAHLVVASSDVQRRDPAESIALAERAARTGKGDELRVAEALATAYAAAGRIDDAIAQVERALKLLEGRDSPRDRTARAGLEDRLKSLREQRRGVRGNGD
jgi:tetratricopeptide (TPR) repeat protein/mono/diheme cytochrome c family protein